LNDIQLEVSGGIATLKLDARGAAVNTVSPPWIEEMMSVFEALKVDATVRGVIIASAKPTFMAGADLKYILGRMADIDEAEGFAFSQRGTALHRLIETCGKPVVAVIEGPALGGGYELALACTRRIVADLPQAVVGLPEVHVGLLPGSGGTQRLPRLVGVERALEVLLQGRSYAPEAALELGLVDERVPAGAVLDAARRWIGSTPDPVRAWDRKGFALEQSDGLLKPPTAALFQQATGSLLAKYGCNYPAPVSILSCVFEGVQVPIEAGLRIESRHFARLIANPVSRNIIRTGFVNKGRAQAGARRPEGVPKATVRKLGILGAGMMGAGIAYAAARAGIEVVLLDTSMEAASKGVQYSAKLLSKETARGRRSEADAASILNRITPVVDYAALAEVDLVVEAVFEDTAVKAEVTRKAQAVIRPDVLFASNTSTLPISRLAEAFARPQHFIGLHFFSPVERMELVEVILGRRTEPAALAQALDFVAQIRKTPIVVNDARGFYTSRVFQTLIHEGMALLAEGVAPALIENAARQAGLPVGPLALLDEVSLALPLKIVRQAMAEDAAYVRPATADVLELMAERLGRGGRKTGQGFYEYPPEGSKRLWRGLGEHFPVRDRQPDVEEVKKRILYVQSIETARCLEEGVLTHPADADLGAVLGWAFPAWTGGTLSLIETVGIGVFVEECERLAACYGARFAPTRQLREMAHSGAGFSY